MRITIIGNCGSGKSTLARKISEKVCIPCVHLDRFWFESNGHTLKKEDTEAREKVRAYIRTKVEEFVKQDSWVSDGWYSRVQPLIAGRADRVVFLDIPLWRRLVNHLYRIFFSERHPGLSRWDDLKFFFEIIRRTSTHGTQMHQFVKDCPDKVVHLRSYKEVNEYLANLE